MTDEQALYFVVCALYLAECVLWAARGSVAFLPGFYHWKTVLGSATIGNARGGMVALNPLSLPGRAFLSHLDPVTLCPDGMCSGAVQTLPGAPPASREWEYVAFGDVSGASHSGSRLFVNGRPFAVCATPAQASGLAALVRELAAAAPEAREEIIRRHVDARHDREAAKTRLDAFAARRGPLTALSCTFLVLVYVAAPWMAVRVGFVSALLFGGAAAVVLGWTLAVLYHRVHRATYPSAGEERLTDMAKMVLCPPSAIRAGDSVSANLLGDYSPLVHCSVLGGAGLGDFVLSYVRDLRYPLAFHCGDPRAKSAARWYADLLLERSLAFAATAQLEFSDPSTPPGHAEDGCRSYCPRCHAQYTMDAGECTDCRGIALVPLDGEIDA